MLEEFEDRDNSTSVLEVTVVKVGPGTLEEAKVIIAEMEVKIKQIEDECLISRNKNSEHEKAIIVKDDEIAVFKGIVNSLEEDSKKKDTRIIRFEKATLNMKKEIDILREFKAGGDKNKKSEKGIKEAEEKLSDSIKTVSLTILQFLNKYSEGSKSPRKSIKKIHHFWTCHTAEI